jgi:hypothetical protein
MPSTGPNSLVFSSRRFQHRERGGRGDHLGIGGGALLFGRTRHRCCVIGFSFRDIGRAVATSFCA